MSLTPNLEYLAINGYNLFDYLLDENNEIRDPPLLGNTLISFIFTACPKISHFHLDCRSERLDVLDDDLRFPTKKAAAVSDDDDQQAYPGSLRYYWNGLSEFDHAEYDMILKCQSTLEHLFIDHIESSNFAADWETFTRRFLPNTTLKYLSLPVTDQPMDWLNACQALEHLELHDIHESLGASIRHALEHQLPSLQRIDLTFYGYGTSWSGGGRGNIDFFNQMQLLRALRYRCNHTDSLKEMQLVLSIVYNKCDLAVILSSVMSIRTLETLAIRRTSRYVWGDESDLLGFIEGLEFSLPHLKHLELDSFACISANVIDAFATVRRLKSFVLSNTKIKMDEATLLIKTMGKHLKDLSFIGIEITARYFHTTWSLEEVARNHAPRCRFHVYTGYSGSRYPYG